jgi:hypothetical protein
LVRGTILAPLWFAQALIRIALGKVHLPALSHSHKGSLRSPCSPERRNGRRQALTRQLVTNRLVGDWRDLKVGGLRPEPVRNDR